MFRVRNRPIILHAFRLVNVFGLLAKANSLARRYLSLPDFPVRSLVFYLTAMEEFSVDW